MDHSASSVFLSDNCILLASLNVTSHGKTYTNAFPLNGLKRWQSVGYPLGSRWKCWENLLDVLRKAVEKLCAEPLKNLLGKFMQAILGVESKQ